MSEPLPTILLIEPVEMDGYLALNVSYGDCTDGIDVDEMVEKHDVHRTMNIVGPRNMPIEVHLCGDRSAPAPIFIGPQPVFCSMIFTTTDWGPFHCEDCAHIICRWFSNKQSEWEDEWERANGSSSSGFNKRLH